MTEFVHVGRHADHLQSGRAINPGDRIDSQELDADGADQYLIDDGVLADVKSFDGGNNNTPTKDDEEQPAAALQAAPLVPPAPPASDQTNPDSPDEGEEG